MLPRIYLCFTHAAQDLIYGGILLRIYPCITQATQDLPMYYACYSGYTHDLRMLLGIYL
jgi:hypothetical protein